MKCPNCKCNSENGVYGEYEDYYLDEDYNEQWYLQYNWDCLDCFTRVFNYENCYEGED